MFHSVSQKLKELDIKKDNEGELFFWQDLGNSRSTNDLQHVELNNTVAADT